MDFFYITLITGFVFLQPIPVTSSLHCLPGCSCTNDRYGRSLLCMETALRGIPENIPQDFIKIRIENSHLTEISRGTFSKVRALEYLWLNFNDITLISVYSLEGLNNLTELRLQGNKLRSVPWTTFQHTPGLKILDLKHNRLDVIPEYALKYLPSLTFLDLSFNQLTVISTEVFLNWPLYSKAEEYGKREVVTSNVVLALHDNPWVCDCRLKGFVQLIESLSPSIILMNSYLICSSPEHRAGKFFHEVELKTCMKPVATAPITNTTVPLGANITLACLAKARPNPAVWWTYGMKIIRGFNESQTQVDEDTVRCDLVIPSLHPADRGVYTCTAFNFIGNASVSVRVNAESYGSSFPLSSAFHLSPAEESARVYVRIVGQTVRGVTLEWQADTAHPAEAWYTLHFGRVGTTKKAAVYVAPGVNRYSLTDLLPSTKYEVCVALRSQAPRADQCIMFLTGSEASELGERGRPVHILVIFCSLVLVVPMGMYLCTLKTSSSCLDCHTCSPRQQRYREKSPGLGGKQGAFDSLQVTTDQDPCHDTEKDTAMSPKPEGVLWKPKSDHRSTAGLY